MKKALILIISAILCALMAVTASAEGYYSDRRTPKIYESASPYYSGIKISCSHYFKFGDEKAVAEIEYGLIECGTVSFSISSVSKLVGYYVDNGHEPKSAVLFPVVYASDKTFTTADAAPLVHNVKEISAHENSACIYLSGIHLNTTAILRDTATGVTFGVIKK